MAAATIAALMTSLLGPARAAVALLTRVPIGAAPLRPVDLRRAPVFFPLVGLALGLAAGLPLWALRAAGPFVSSALTIALLLVLTGALHEDGLADTADALGGSRTRERLFAILKDSRIGTFGAVALITSLVLRTAALAQLGGRAAAALICAQALSRLPAIWLMASMPYVTPLDQARSGAAAQTTPMVAIAAGLVAGGLGLGLVAVAGVPGRGLAIGVAALVPITALLGARFQARAGGVTGDFLGATQQVSEVTLLVALAAAA